jgi:hypothetical protein
VVAPRAVLPIVGGAPADRGAATVARVLGMRQIIQAAAIVRWPRPRAQLVSAAVDASHAASMVALGRWGGRRAHRQLARNDARVAGLLALSGVVSAAGRGERNREVVSSFPGS